MLTWAQMVHVPLEDYFFLRLQFSILDCFGGLCRSYMVPFELDIAS